jgi:hypothetical protein
MGRLCEKEVADNENQEPEEECIEYGVTEDNC